MSYIRKPKGKKNFQIEYTYRGKRYVRSLGVGDRSSAMKIQALIDYQIAMGELDERWWDKMSRDGMTYFEFFDEYKSFVDKQDFSDRTVEAYTESAKLFKKIVGDIPLKNINVFMVEKEILPYLYQKYNGSSPRHHMGNFRIMFGKALEWGIVDKNPFERRVPKKKKRIPRYYRDKELQIMRDYFARPNIPRWQGDAVFLVLNTGLRRSELLNLDWEKHVYLDNEQIIFSGKGNKDRVVPLNADAVRILLSRPRHIKYTRVFWEIVSKDAINSMWKRMRNRTKLTGTFHELRKTFACMWVINGGSLEHLREILGHEDYETVRIYATLSPESVHKYKNVISFDQKRYTGT